MSALIRSRGSLLGGTTLAGIALDDRLAGADIYRQSTTFLAMALQQIQTHSTTAVNTNDTLPDAMNRTSSEDRKSSSTTSQDKPQKQESKQQKQDGKQDGNQKQDKINNKADEKSSDKQGQVPEAEQQEKDQREEDEAVNEPVAAVDGAATVLGHTGVAGKLTGLMRRMGEWLDSQMVAPASETIPQEEQHSASTDAAATKANDSAPDRKG